MKKVFANAWNIIREPNNNNSQVALAIAVIVVGSLTGIVCAAGYGFAARSGGFWASLSGALIAALSCVGAFSAGGMLGLLFGSPTWGNAPPPTATGSGDKTPDQRSGGLSGLRPNTSLEKIADWLTTMLVGLSLVHLKSIESRATDLAVYLTRSISGDPKTLNGSPGIAIVLSFSFAGFLLVYLWAMRFLPSELRNSYADLSQRLDDVEQRNKQLLAEFKRTADFSVSDDTLQAVEARLNAGGVDDATRAEIQRRYKESRKADSEPMKQFGEASSAGYKLSAIVVDKGAGFFEIKVSLEGPDDAAADKVFWLLHNTFSPEIVSECPIKAGAATYTTTVNEAFWIGAAVPVTDAPTVRLSFDLSRIDGAPSGFIAQAASTH